MLGAFFGRILAWIAPLFFTFIWDKIVALILAFKQKKEEDKKVDDSVGKVETGGLESGLEGTGELEDEFNKNA